MSIFYMFWIPFISDQVQEVRMGESHSRHSTNFPLDIGSQQI